jgi:NAD+ synthase
VESFLRASCIFSHKKRATLEAPFFCLEKNNLTKKLETNSWISFRNLLFLQIYNCQFRKNIFIMQNLTSVNADRIANQIVTWLRVYAENAKVNGFVIGISGGVDSAVTSTLCAMTGLKVLCVEMPIHQAPSHVSRGREHIAQLKNRFENVSNIEADLTSVFDDFKTSVPNNVEEWKVNLALANSRARLRMTALYYLAGINGLLVAGTGNKVEDFGVGFYTKYGDGGVDLSPIADLMKSDVFELGKFLKIPLSIQNAAPTDGLFGDDRTDEDQLGATYNELEWAMREVANKADSSNYLGREKDVFEIYNRLHNANLHKMNPIPVCEIEW